MQSWLIRLKLVSIALILFFSFVYFVHSLVFFLRVRTPFRNAGVVGWRLWQLYLAQCVLAWIAPGYGPFMCSVMIIATTCDTKWCAEQLRTRCHWEGEQQYLQFYLEHKDENWEARYCRTPCGWNIATTVFFLLAVVAFIVSDIIEARVVPGCTFCPCHVDIESDDPAPS